MESNKGNLRTLLISFKDYNENFLKIAKYVITMKTPKAMDKRDFWKFKQEALNYDIYSRKV